MKKIISIFLSLCIVIGLCACGNDTSNDTSSSKENNETKSTYDEISLGSTIETEFADVSFIDIKISNTIKNEKPKVDLKDESDKVYFVLYGEVANTGTDSLALSIYANVLIDDTYTYNMRMELEEIAPLVPLDSEKFLLYASLPDEVFNACNNYSLKIGFNENFHALKTEVEECEYKFEINGTVDEFGSADSVEDFQSLTEYVNTLLSNSSYSDLLPEIDMSSKIIKIYSNPIIKVSHNDETFHFFPRLGIYAINNSVSGELQLNISSNGDSASYHYSSFENLIIESSNGVYEHNNSRRSTDDTGTWGENTWGRYTDFRVNDIEVAEQLLNVLSGDNIIISLDAVTTQDNEIQHLTFECTENVKDTMIDLCNIFIDIESKGFSFK